MAHISIPKGYNLPEHRVTPQGVFANRRQILAGTAAGLIAAGTPGLALGQRKLSSPEADPTVDLYPAPADTTYAAAQGDRALSARDDALSFNNFYEYGTNKDIWRAAQALPRRPWTLSVDGLVARPQTFDVDALIRAFDLEERVYRHRCVETWSMIVPWTGFALSALIDRVEPLGSARYVAFETADLRDKGNLFSGQFPWPYREGLRLDEARNELALVGTGIYGEPMPSQNGAPLRLVLPWKYGFKSIKSIVRMTLTDTPPSTFWSDANGQEYGFWANVNPDVPHRRWSQAQEWDISQGRDTVFPTQKWNGYGPWVAPMYADMDPVATRLFT